MSADDAYAKRLLASTAALSQLEPRMACLTIGLRNALLAVERCADISDDELRHEIIRLIGEVLVQNMLDLGREGGLDVHQVRLCLTLANDEHDHL